MMLSKQTCLVQLVLLLFFDYQAKTRIFFLVAYALSIRISQEHFKGDALNFEITKEADFSFKALKYLRPFSESVSLSLITG